ncbi:hypothetical protein HN51_069272, partial [Arachis hypogaea]
WNEWDAPSMEFTWWTPAHFRQMLDNITNANFLWDSYSLRHLGSDFMLHDMHGKHVCGLHRLRSFPLNALSGAQPIGLRDNSGDDKTHRR